MIANLAKSRKNELTTEHKDGTYVKAVLSQDSRDRLGDWVHANGINNALHRDVYHTTIIYSRAPCPEAAEYDFNLPIEAKIVGWEIFNAPFGRCLVAKLESEQLQIINSDIMKMGATSDYDEYIPHITISYDYQHAKPPIFPAMTIRYSDVKVKELDLNWSPPKSKK